MRTLTLRQRIVLSLVPVFVLLALLGGAAVPLLYRLGTRIDAILKDNYDSVIYMENLNEALERIDSSFTFALAGQEDKARKQYDADWKLYEKSLVDEQANITIHPDEDELVARLTALTTHYRALGDAFYRRSGDGRHLDYFGPNGLLKTFQDIKGVAHGILELNEHEMQRASAEARQKARHALIGFGFGLTAVVALLIFSVAWAVRSVLRPIRAVTQSALAIGGGNLDQVVPVSSDDELGRLAEAFNTMARQLRHYRQTDYSRLLRAQRTSQATIDSFPDPVVVVNEEGCVEMANPAAQRLFGVGGRKAGDTSPLQWQPPEPLHQPLAEALRDQRPYVPEGFDRLVTLHADGPEYSFLPRVLPIRDPYGNTLGAAVLLEDVTRFRLLDQVKSNLVATVSHELKTPLTSVRLALHLLLEEVCGALTPKQTELLLDARENAERLLDRVNHLLDLAKLEQQHEPLDLRPTAAGDLLREAATAIRPRAQDKGVEVVVEAPPDLPPVAVDPKRLAHALGNLLDNAVEFTDRGGKITLSAAAADQRVVLSVADTGAGIPPEYLPRVFEKFFRVPEQSRHEGTGLGLAIVREIVQAHSGSITCESPPGVGTVFRISLPVAGSQESGTRGQESGLRMVPS